MFWLFIYLNLTIINENKKELHNFIILIANSTFQQLCTHDFKY